MQESSIFSGKSKTQLGVPFTQKVTVIGDTDNPEEIAAKNSLINYLVKQGIELVESRQYGYNHYKEANTNPEQVASIFDTTSRESVEDCILIDITFDRAFRKIVTDGFNYPEFSDTQESFMEAFKATKIINLVVLTQSPVGFVLAQIQGLSTLLKIGSNISTYRDSSTGIMSVSKLIDEPDLILNALYKVPKGMNIVFGKESNTNLRLTEIDNQAVINGIWFE